MLNKIKKQFKCVECGNYSLQSALNHGICYSCDEEISVCSYCRAPSEEKGNGDEGWSFCTEGCGLIEGHTENVNISELIKWGRY